MATPRKNVGPSRRVEPPTICRPQVGEVWQDNTPDADLYWLIIHEDTTSVDKSLALTARRCDETGRELYLVCDTFAADGTGGENGRELVRKVVPVKVMYINVYEKGRSAGIVAHATRESADEGAGSSRRDACVRVEYAEGQFDE